MTVMLDANDTTSSSHQEITLVAVPRPSEVDRGNLFVRLTPTTAWRLASLLLSSPSGDCDGDGDNDGGDDDDRNYVSESVDYVLTK